MNLLHKMNKGKWWLERVDEEIQKAGKDERFVDICDKVWRHPNPDYRTHDPAIHMAEEMVWNEIENTVEEFANLSDEEKHDYFSDEYRESLQKFVNSDWCGEVPMDVAWAAVEYALEYIDELRYDQISWTQRSGYAV